MKHKIVYKYCIIGALVGYFVFHPLVMLLSNFMATHYDSGAVTAVEKITSVILKSFSFAMLPWSLSFAFFNGVIGLYYGTIEEAKLAREELIINLQKALTEVKTLSGLLPICSWCNKIRDDEGYWQKIDSYLKSHSDLDFTHAICNDCAEKEYPELYSGSKKKSDN